MTSDDIDRQLNGKWFGWIHNKDYPDAKVSWALDFHPAHTFELVITVFKGFDPLVDTFGVLGQVVKSLGQSLLDLFKGGSDWRKSPRICQLKGAWSVSEDVL